MKKIIATGKGGAGKTTIVATISRLLSQSGKKVLVMDTDPSMNLAMSLGVPFSEIRTLAEDKAKINDELIDDNFDINKPSSHSHEWNIDIDAFLENYAKIADDNVKVVVMGTISEGGAGCICSYISLVKRIIVYLSLWSNEYDVIIVDSQAGSEILGRGLAANYDYNLVITESFPKSMEVARHVLKLGNDLNIKNQIIVINKLKNEKEIGVVQENLHIEKEMIYPVNFDQEVIDADRMGSLIIDTAPNSAVIKDIYKIIDAIDKN